MLDLLPDLLPDNTVLHTFCYVYFVTQSALCSLACILGQD